MKRRQQSYGFSNEPGSEFPDYFHYNDRHQSPWPDDLSSAIVSRTGSSSSSMAPSAFYATEQYMGLSQCDFQESRFLGGSYSSFVLPEGSYITPFNDLSESEQLLHLRNKLLGDLDDSNRQSPSLPFDASHDLQVSKNFCAPQFAHSRQFPCNNSVTSSASISSSKTRIRWTQELHDRFVECVNTLGGPEKATPKAILKLMDTEGLTIFHVKSHLQKYRNAKYIPESVEGKAERKSSANNNTADTEIKTNHLCRGMELKEALRLQLGVQRRLHEQLEIQRNLQMRIEEQGKQLKMMFDQQQKTNQSFTETSNKCPSNLSNIHEDHLEAFIIDGPDDGDIFFRSKIS